MKEYSTVLTALFALTASLFGGGVVMKPESLLTEIVLLQTAPHLTRGFIYNNTEKTITIDSLRLVSTSNGLNLDSLGASHILINEVSFSLPPIWVRPPFRDSVWVNGENIPVTIKAGDSIPITNSIICVGSQTRYWYNYRPSDYDTSPTLTHFWMRMELYYGDSSVSVWFSGDSSSYKEVSIIERQKMSREVSRDGFIYNFRGQQFPVSQGNQNVAPSGAGLYIQRNSFKTNKILIEGTR